MQDQPEEELKHGWHHEESQGVEQPLYNCQRTIYSTLSCLILTRRMEWGQKIQQKTLPITVISLGCVSSNHYTTANEPSTPL
ncbi:hypothetical protein, partial [Raoultella ornithinolytica]|uniref:hypothetical protein n=1 Tax=Raoultella ornithinolytica TaxID=54291 RepID=UPI001D031C67